MRSGIGVAIASLALGLVSHAPVQAAQCTYTYNQDGFPRWSDACSTVVSPGRFGPLKMGTTTVAEARAKNYLAKNTMCGGRLDGVAAFNNWRRKDGKVHAWTAGGSRTGSAVRTSKGLVSTDALAKARRLYPGMAWKGYLEIPYAPGTGWDIYSVRGKRGWLDFYVHDVKKRYNFFAVRAGNSTKPIKNWSLDGC